MSPTSRVVTTEIENLLDHLINAGIAIYANPVLDRGGVVSWPRLRGASLVQRGVPTLESYRQWVTQSAYSAILFDGSLLQLTYEFVGGNLLVRHRLAYVPFPFDAGREQVQELPVIDLLDLCASEGAAKVALRSAVRFDFDLEAQRTGHPASHLTLNSHSCRIACTAPLRLGRFVRFVFGHFYPYVWEVDSYLPTVSQRSFGDRTITAEEFDDFHLAWRV
jgi:hypothetical protein